MSDDPNDPNPATTANDPTPAYKVGYKRPPLEHRFKPGRSGNTSGGKRRPKLPDIAALLDQPVRVRVNGKQEALPPREAALLRLAVDAAQGRRKAVLEFARPKDLDAALRAAWPAYKASRTAEQARIEAEIGHAFITEIER